jgi:SAM-dependent methyltransferase
VSAVKIRDAYGAVAPLYISMFGSAEQTHPDDLDLICRHLGDVTGPVLDLGCGPGHLSRYLNDLGVDVTGVDLVPEFINHARATHPGIPFTVGTLQSSGRPDHSWSGILAWYSLIHDEPAQLDIALDELRRAIADNGLLVTGCFTADEVGAFDHKVLTAYRWPVDEFAQRLSRAGFAELERLARPAEGPVRAHAAIAVRAI